MNMFFCFTLFTLQCLLCYLTDGVYYITFSQQTCSMSYVFPFLQISGSMALCVRGGCDFTTKAEFAESGGATGMLVINDAEGPF